MMERQEVTDAPQDPNGAVQSERSLQRRQSTFPLRPLPALNFCAESSTNSGQGVFQADSYGKERRCHCSCHQLHSESQSLEDDQTYNSEWNWDPENKSENIELSHPHYHVVFHKHFSNGTAAVRGSKPLTEGQHYWEVKMTSSVYGTDMMVGFGTADVDLSAYTSKFVSLLGMDTDSWGLSYSGNLMHNGQKRAICKRFGQGMVIGIHLDMWLGKVSLFKNGRYLGVVSTEGIRGKKIYPMACSTAARTSMRIVRSCSFPTTLQFLCCQKLREIIQLDLNVTKAVKLAPGLALFLENNLDWLIRPYIPEDYNSSMCTTRKRPINCVHEQLSTDRTLCKKVKVTDDSDNNCGEDCDDDNEDQL